MNQVLIDACERSERSDARKKARGYTSAMLKLGVVRVLPLRSDDEEAFTDVMIDGARVKSFVRDGAAYVTATIVKERQVEWGQGVPYTLAGLMKCGDVAVDSDGRSEWWFAHGGGMSGGVGPMLLTDAGARTISMITGVPIVDSSGSPEVDRDAFFEESAALVSLAEWCKAHPVLAKRNRLSAEALLEGGS